MDNNDIKKLLWRIFRTKLFWPAAGASGLMVFGALCQVFAPLFLKNSIDYFSSSEVAAGLSIFIYVVMLGAARFAQAAFTPLYAVVERRLLRFLSIEIYRHTLFLPFSFHIGRRTGELNRIISDGLNSCRTILVSALYIFVPTFIEISATGWILSHIFDIYMFMSYVAFVVAYSMVFYLSVKKQKEAQITSMKIDGRISNLFLDSLINYENVKVFTSERSIIKRIDSLEADSERQWIKFYFARMKNSFVLGMVFTLSFGWIFVIAIRRLAQNNGSPSDLLLVALYLLQVVMPIERIATMSRELMQSLTHLERLLEIFAEKTESSLIQGDAAVPGTGPVAIRVEGLWYFHHMARPTLRDISFEILAGRCLAVVGASGGGKSTLARLLFRFHAPTRGAIFVDGVAIDSIGLEDLRRAFALAPQDCVLFNDTLRDNVLFARPEATRVEVEAAMRAAALDEVIARLPQGEETIVGERGLRLSGGEKQRVAIARALLRRPRLLVFDEATSSLDTRTERLIQDRLEIAAKGVTRLVIAHRLSTVVDADEIIVLEDGAIVERGDHARLIASGGAYARMWAAQRRAEESEALNGVGAA